MTELTRINQQGHAKMVDASDKQITKRTTIAHSSVIVNGTIFRQISSNADIKGNILDAAQVTGIMTAKNTLTLIPTRRPLSLTDVDVHFSQDKINIPLYTLNIQTTVFITGKTSVKMEVLTAASAATLTTYDMTEAVDEGMITDETYLGDKPGGKSGDFQCRLSQ